MTTYRLLYARILRLGVNEPVDPNTEPHYFRRRSAGSRSPYINWFLVTDKTVQAPTEWRTLEGITKFLDSNPSLREQFDIVEVS